MENPSEEPNDKSGNCIELLQVMLDGQASNEQRGYFDEHIEKCIYCLKEYNLGSEIKELMRIRASKQPVPKDLINTIRTVVLSAK